MFLNLLTPAQQELFMQAAQLIAAQDGEVSELETALLDGLAQEAGLDALPDAIELSDALARAPELLDEGPARRAFLLELAGVTVIDGEVHPAEVERLQEFASALGVSRAEEFDAFLEFAGQARAVVEAGQALIATATEGR